MTDTSKTVTSTYVLATIHKQQQNLLKYNRAPTLVYLGYQEMDALMAMRLEEFSVYCHQRSDGERLTSYVLKLKIHQVNESNHIKVTD